MPQLGDIAKGRDIGKRTQRRMTFVYHACKNCGKQRWVSLCKGQPKFAMCNPCATRRIPIMSVCQRCGKPYRAGPAVRAKRRFCSLECRDETLRGPNVHTWRGGRTYKGGYVWVWLDKDDFFFPMTHGHKHPHVAEHRLVIARDLGRCLTPFEVVHHKNGIRDDNRLENLELSTRNAHSKDHSQGYNDGYRKGLHDGHSKRIRQLVARIAELEASR
jgi:hypothetical protein